MLLWWSLDRVPLPVITKSKVVKDLCNGDLSDERKFKITSIKPNWQPNWTNSVITSLLLSGTFVRRTTYLEKTANINWLPFSLLVSTSADAFLHKRLGAQSTIRFITQYTKRTRLHMRAIMHPSKVPQKPIFIVSLSTWTWNANCSLWIRNVMYKSFTTPT